MKYLVTIDRPFYPSVDYCKTLEEAEALRDGYLEEHTPDGSYPVQVVIAEIITSTPILTNF